MKIFVTYKDDRVMNVIARNKSVCIKAMKEDYPDYKYHDIIKVPTSGNGGGDLGMYSFVNRNDFGTTNQDQTEVINDNPFNDFLVLHNYNEKILAYENIKEGQVLYFDDIKFETSEDIPKNKVLLRDSLTNQIVGEIINLGE